MVQTVGTTSTYLLDCTNSRVHNDGMACSPSPFFDYHAKSKGGSILNLLGIDSSLALAIKLFTSGVEFCLTTLFLCRPDKKLPIDPPLAASPHRKGVINRHEEKDLLETSLEAIEVLKKRLNRQRETIQGRDELLIDQARQIQEMKAHIEDLTAKVNFRTNSCDGCCEGEKASLREEGA